jgi:threonine dehydratase
VDRIVSESRSLGSGTPDRLTRDDIDRAERRLAGRLWRTPVVRCLELDRASGARLWLKAENLQLSGSFKIRGALLAVGRLAAAGSRGIVAQSTGNHAIAVAWAAREHRLPVRVVLPSDAPAGKVAKVRELGGQVMFAGLTLAERIGMVAEQQARLGYDVVDPYEDLDVVAGQGTATAELIRQVEAEGGRLDAVVVPVGGGSAIAGACVASAGTQLTVVGAEPRAVPALAAALRAGQPVTVDSRPTLADGLRPDRIGRLPFGLCHRIVHTVLPVGEPEIAHAWRQALLQARLLIEPAAAVALAAALEHGRELGDEVGVLLTGGNLEPALVTSLLPAPD